MGDKSESKAQAERQLVQMLSDLEIELQRAKREFDGGERSGRQGVITAVTAVTDFLNRVPRLNEQDLELPLAILLARLMDLDDGKGDPLFEPNSPKHRPPDSRTTQAIRAYSAHTMDWLMKLGLKRSDASRRVARVLSNAGFVFGQRRGEPHQTVAAWRDRLRRFDAKGFDASVYEDLRSDSLEFGSSDQEAIRQNFLMRLKHLVRAAGVNPSD